MRLRFILYIICFILGFILGAFIFYSIYSKSEEPQTIITHAIVVDKIERMGNLEVVKYNLQDIMEYKKMRQWLPNAKTALLINGEIIVCVDLTKIREDRVSITGDSIALILPPPEICHVRVDHSKSRVYDMTYGLWESAQLMDEAYKHAQKELEAQARRLDLTKEARDNTSAILTPLLNAFGFNHVTIIYDDRLNTY